MTEAWEKEAPPPKDAPLRTDGPTLAEYVAAGYKAENYPPTGFAVKPAANASSLEDRVTALENVVHEIAPYSRNAEHGTVTAWLKGISARLKGDVKKVV
jgi:hypothetical protein